MTGVYFIAAMARCGHVRQNAELLSPTPEFTCFDSILRANVQPASQPENSNHSRSSSSCPEKAREAVGSAQKGALGDEEVPSVSAVRRCCNLWRALLFIRITYGALNCTRLLVAVARVQAERRPCVHFCLLRTTSSLLSLAALSGLG